MNTPKTVVLSLLLLVFGGQIVRSQEQPPQRYQYPSPMVENTRRHDRIPQAEYDGLHLILDDILPKPVDVYMSKRAQSVGAVDLVISFHSAPFITHHAAESSGVEFVGVTVQLGGASGAYNAPFEDTTAFVSLLDAVKEALRDEGVEKNWSRVVLTGFSAGYGAVRRILSQPYNRKLVDAVLLLDAIHASYIPERTVLAEGGIIDSSHLKTFLSFAREAANPGSPKRFIITHSEVFPGTFVSTTEATDWILQHMGLNRTPVLKWGPLGMQQLSQTSVGNFNVLGFAGNSGIDHVDHLHAFGQFLRLLAWGDRPDH